MSAGTEKQGLGKGRQRSINFAYLVHLHEKLSQMYRREYLLFVVCCYIFSDATCFSVGV